jgi:hypothetical protein
MDSAERRSLIEEFGTSAVILYVCVDCVEALMARLPTRDQVIERVAFWPGKVLAGKFLDIDKCDECGARITADHPRGYLCVRLTSCEELEILCELREMQQEPTAS